MSGPSKANRAAPTSSRLTNFEGKVFVDAYKDTHGRELCAPAAPARGTKLVRDTNPERVGAADGAHDLVILRFGAYLLLMAEAWSLPLCPRIAAHTLGATNETRGFKMEAWIWPAAVHGRSADPDKEAAICEIASRASAQGAYRQGSRLEQRIP
jgi:hypothetical protein